MWAPRELGSSLLASPVHLQIQRPVVKTSTEQLAQELEGLAQAQVRGKQGPPLGSRRNGGLGRQERVGGCEGKGRGLRTTTSEA